MLPPTLKKILLLEDEESIRSFVTISLKRAGYTPVTAETAAEAFEVMKQNPDIRIAILDVMLPDSDIDGFEVCRRLRAVDDKIGIIILSARVQEMDKVTGLMTGADDYIEKPFSPSELNARVDALYRRVGGNETVELINGPFKLTIPSRTFEKNGERIKLTTVEFSIMRLFMENPGKAIRREDILTHVWGAVSDADVKIVDVNIRRLRIKIEDNPQDPQYITAIWAFGYKWNP